MELIEQGFNPISLGLQFGYSEPSVIRRIDELSQISDGWHFGTGEHPSESVLAIAKSVASYAISCGISSVDVFPTKNGGVTVVAYTGDDDHSFEVRSDWSFRYWNESDPESDIQEGLNQAQVIQKIDSLSKSQWNLSSSFIPDTGIAAGVASEARLFTIQAMGAVFQSLNTVVSFADLSDAFASTPGNIIRLSAQNLQYSGDSTNRSCLPATA